MHVVLWYDEKGGEALAEPHGDLSVHVDSEGLKAFLETTHGVVLKGAGVLAQVHTSDLRHTQTAHRDETWRGLRDNITGLSGRYISVFKKYHLIMSFHV